jgi:hypothetical protein
MGQMQSGGYIAYTKATLASSLQLCCCCCMADGSLLENASRVLFSFFPLVRFSPSLLFVASFQRQSRRMDIFFFLTEKRRVHYAWKDYIKSLSNKNGESDTSQISKLGAIKNTFKMKQPSPTQYYSTYYVYTRYHLAGAHIRCHGKQRGLKEAHI